MTLLFEVPRLAADHFHCPFCEIHSLHLWRRLFYHDLAEFGGGRIPLEALAAIPDLYASLCVHCRKQAIWYGRDMIYPRTLPVPLPNHDLDEEIRVDYLEAARIVQDSPRGAAALLRLCLQKMCKQLGESGKNINADIKALVGKGLPPIIQQSLDILRVVGNNAVHPGQLDIRDDFETGMKLFSLINFIADDRITRPRQIQELYKSLPPESREQIQKRDEPPAQAAGG